MKNVEYWMWLQNSLGVGANVADIVSYFGSVRALYEADENALRESGLFGYDLLEPQPKKIASMKSTSLSLSADIISYCKSHRISIITPDDDEYPASLKSIQNYPAVLFCKGDVSILDSDRIFAVIGTRNPSDYGRKACREIVHGLAENGAIIASGGALGIDSVAHRSSVEAGSETILVMGCGINAAYLMSNSGLREFVSQHGVLVSEYAPLVPPTRYSFILRNRIVSAISRGIVVVEAGEKSGTLNTCSYAKKQFKPIFVLPGDIDSPLYAGSRQLSKEGAKTVYKAEDIYSWFGFEITHPTAAAEELSAEPFDGIASYTPVEGEQNGVSKTERLRKKKSVSKLNNVEKTSEEVQATGKTTVETQPVEENKAEIPQPVEGRTLDPDEFSENAIAVYELMKTGKLTVDDLTRSCNLPSFKVLQALTELEMESLIEKKNAVEYEIL